MVAFGLLLRYLVGGHMCLKKLIYDNMSTRDVIDSVLSNYMSQYDVTINSDKRTSRCREVMILLEEDYFDSESPTELIPPEFNYLKVSVNKPKYGGIFDIVVFYLDSTLYIHKIWIHDKYRRQGISTEVIKEVCRDFRLRGFSCQVSIPLTGAGRNLLKSAGFQRELKIRGKSVYSYDG